MTTLLALLIGLIAGMILGYGLGKDDEKRRARFNADQKELHSAFEEFVERNSK